MKFEVRSNRTFFYTKKLYLIKKMLNECNIEYNELLFNTNSGGNYTLYRVRLKVQDTNKLISNGCTKMIREKNSLTGEFFLRKSKKSGFEKRVKVIKKCTDGFNKKKIIFPKIIRGFSGNIITGKHLIFK